MFHVAASRLEPMFTCWWDFALICLLCCVHCIIPECLEFSTKFDAKLRDSKTTTDSKRHCNFFVGALGSDLV